MEKALAGALVDRTLTGWALGLIGPVAPEPKDKWAFLVEALEVWDRLADDQKEKLFKIVAIHGLTTKKRFRWKRRSSIFLKTV